MSLQSHETKDLLDIVDSLRSHGINRYINLPEIIVCGEQSSGKSSVLEAVSGVKFPSKDNLCTRFATELILRRGANAPIKVSIVPGSRERDRSESDLEKLRNFHYSVSADDLQIEAVIEAAKDAMGISHGSDRVFSSDILRLELSGPDQPHLTLVDLPGLFQAGSRSQSDADAVTVKSLVLSYMKNPRSIILAVVSAKNDFNNQSITKHSREIDPKGHRTLGLITKPDTLDKGSDSESFYLELAQNKEVKFRLGWHVLRNRDFTTRDSTTEERDRTEALFFENGIWKSLSADQTGVHSLKLRLSKILKDHIAAQLPDVLVQIKDGIQESTLALPLQISWKLTIKFVAQKKIIDDFSVLAIEARLIQELPSLFSPADVIDIDDVMVSNLASESEESSRERTRCSEKLKILEHGHKALQGVQDISPPRPDIKEGCLQNSVHLEHERESQALSETVSYDEEEHPQIAKEGSSPHEVHRSGNRWDSSFTFSMPIVKEKGVDGTMPVVW
ncbi:hypothetical protein ACET3X_003683 [Alternaria dauci]|uniref:Interferon-induced GTP-binding protein Mx n=1 Tax=Alternaria dauci TaxID=48095 RepID=A0ABR3UT64_9PLEO